MSKTIDERVVSMQFDNKQFERNVQTSLSTLDKLKRALNIDGAAKGLEGVSSAAKKMDLSGISSAADTLKSNFSALEVIGVTALANIANSAVNAGKQMLQSLTIAPIKQGFDEYELKMGSIQTMMMSTGESLETVNKYLDELNTYADKTIYSFSDMTSNIGKFTNAGVRLKDSVKAIQGVSNVAAISGANANEASRAMYNFAQALSAGSVKLIDWKSIENANMATVEFKNQLIETAVAMGTLVESEGKYISTTTDANGKVSDAFTATSMFNDSLSHQWMTTDVLVETLGRYSDETTEIGKKAFAAAQDVKTFTQLMDTLQEAVGSGWAMTWEILFGDFEEAKSLWTGLSNTVGGFIDDQSKARNELLKIWKDMGGRDDLIEAAKNSFGGLLDVVQPIQEAFREIFPPITAQQLKELTERLKEITSHFRLSAEASENLKNTFKGLFAIVDIVGQAFSAVLSAVSPLLGGFTKLSGGILGVTGSWGEWLVKLDESIRKNNTFGKAIETVISWLKKASDSVKDFVFDIPGIDKVKNAFKELVEYLRQNFKMPGLELVHSLLERIQTRLGHIGSGAQTMANAVGKAFKAIGATFVDCDFFGILEKLLNGLKKMGSGLVSGLGSIMSGLAKALGEADFSGVFDLLAGLSMGGIAVGLNKFIKSLTGPVDGLSGIMDNVKGIFDDLRGCLTAYQEQIKAGILLKIAAAVGILAASLVAISLIDSEKLVGSLGAITVVFADLVASMAILQRQEGKLRGVGVTMLEMAAAVLILSSALKKLGELDNDELGRGLVGVIALMGSLIASVKLMENSGKGFTGKAAGMVVFAASIKILASAARDLASLNWEDLIQGLVGVGALMAEVSVFLRTAKFGGKAVSTGAGIVLIAASIKVLASACKDFSGMSWGEIAKGLTGVGALLAEVTAFTNLTGNAKHVVSTGLTLIEIAAAMKIFASAMSGFGSMSWEEIGRGLVAMGGALAEVAIAMNLMPKNIAGIGASLVIVGAALEIVTNVLGKMGGMSWEEIGKGLVTMGVSLAEFAIALNLMNGTLGGSAALLVASAAMAVLAPVLSLMGAMSWESIAKGLVAMAGAFTVIGVAGALLGPLVPTILALSASIALLGVGVVAIGAGLLAAGAGLAALAIGFTALAASLAAGATSIVAGLTVVIVGIADLIPLILAKLGEGIVEFCKVIAESAPALGEAVKAVVLTLVDVLVECVPAIADGVLKLIDEILKALVAYTPSIVNSLMQFVIGVIQAVGDALSNVDVSSLLTGIIGIGLMSGLVALLSAILPMIPGAMAAILGVGVLIAEVAAVLAAIGALGKIPGFNELLESGGTVLENIGTAIGKFFGGIVGGFMGGVSAQFPKIGSDLSAFMQNVQPFIEGASSIDSSMLSGISSLTKAILLITAAEIIDGIASWLLGGSSLASFGEQLVPFGEAMAEFSETVDGKVNVSAIEGTAQAGKALSDLSATLQGSGGVVQWWSGEKNLATFGENIQVFGEAIADYSRAVDGKVNAGAIIMSATAGSALSALTNSLNESGGVVQWWTGEKSLSAFAENIVDFGNALAQYSHAIDGNLNVGAILMSAAAGSALSALTNSLNESGGVVQWWTGEKSLADFGRNIYAFGVAIAAYSDAIGDGFKMDAITASIEAGKALADLTSCLENSGGVVQWWTGDKDLAGFGMSIVLFGKAIADFSDSVGGGLNVGSMLMAVMAGQAIANLTNSLEASGGVVQWWTGGKDFAGFATNISLFGNAIADFSNSVAGGLNIGSMLMATVAGQAIANLTATLENSGGVVQWWTGSKDFAGFATNISLFGNAIADFSESVSGGLNVGSMLMAVAAGQAIANLTSSLENSGGVVQWWTGDKDLDSFALNITTFGRAMSDFSDAVGESVNTSAMLDSVKAGEALASLTSQLSNSGGVVQWWTGQSSLEGFASQIAGFGTAIAEFSEAVDGNISIEAVNSAVEAGAGLAELTTKLSASGGVVQWWTGQQSLSNFGSQLTGFGEAIAELSDAVKGKVSVSAIKNASSAGIALAELTSKLGTSGGVVQWWSGQQNLETFGNQIVGFGNAMADFSTAIDGKIAVTAIREATEAGDALAELANTIPQNGSAVLAYFGNDIQSFGTYLKSFSATIEDVSFDAFASAMEQINALADFARGLDNFEGDGIKNFGEALTAIGQAGINGFIKAFTDAQPRAKSTGLALINCLADGARSNISALFSVGVNAGQGLINGMNAMRGSVWSAGWYLGNAALQAAKVALDSHSPSREFIYLGQHAGEGFKIGINNWIAPTAKTTSKMMETSISVAKKGLKAFEEWADERKYYGELATMEELEGYKQLQKMYKEGSEERKKIDRQVYALENQIVKDTFEFSKKWIEKEEYYDRLSTEAKLAAWKRIQARYMGGSEERIEADREVYALEKQLEDERYQERLDHIDNEVFYGRMGLREELAALEELQSQYEKNSEKWLELDKKIYTKRQEVVKDFYDKLNEYISNEKDFLRFGDVDELGTILAYLDQFDEGTDEWKKGLKSAFNLVISIGEAQIQYEKDVEAAQAEHAEKRLQMEEEYAEKVKSINKKLEEDIEDLNQKYEDAVQSRADSLYKSYGLFDEVKKKDEVSGDTLIKNLKGQVAEFDEWQAMLKSLEAKGVNADMIAELEQMGPSSIANVRALNNMTSTQLTQYVNLWATKHRQAREQATDELEGMRVETQTKIAQLKVDAAKELDEYKATWQKKMKELDTALAKNLEDLQTNFYKSIGLISKYTEEEFSKMATNVSQILSAKGYNIGKDLVLGIIKGYNESMPELLKTSDELMKGTTGTMKKAADINSPSKVTYQFGVFMVQGLIEAFYAMRAKTYAAGADLAGTAQDGMVNAIQLMMAAMDENLEMEPTIRPVLDLSGISQNADALENMLYSEYASKLAGDIQFGMDSSRAYGQARLVVDNDDVVEAIDELREDMAVMADAISQMQVVMDTGSLVGSIAAPMDSILGRRQVFKGRGN